MLHLVIQAPQNNTQVEPMLSENVDIIELKLVMVLQKQKDSMIMGMHLDMKILKQVVAN